MKDFEIYPADDVTIVFRKVIREGPTTVEKPETGPEPPPGVDKIQYYDIQTKAIYEGNIKIRIISERANQGRLLQWSREQWVDKTMCCMIVGRKYKLIVGVTDHLSIFGVT